MGGLFSSDEEVEVSQEEWAALEQAQQNEQLYEKFGKPVENEYMDRVRAMDDPYTKQRVSNLAERQVQSQYADAIQEVMGKSIQSGVNPADGQFSSGLGIRDAGVMPTAMAGINARLNQDKAHTQHLQNVLAIGDGQQTRAVSGVMQQANQASGDAIRDAVENYQQEQNIKSAATTAAGAALAAKKPAVASQPDLNTIYRQAIP